MDRNDGLVGFFFAEARSVFIGNQRNFTPTTDDLYKIAIHPAMRAEFKRQLALINDPELQDQIVQFVLDLADSADDSANEANRSVELLDRAGLGISASVTVAGIGATTAMAFGAKGAAVGSLIGPVGTLVGGLVGLAVSAIGRELLKRRSDTSKSVGQKLRRLVGK